MVPGSIDEGTGCDHGSLAPWAESTIGAIADSVCGLRCVAAEAAGRRRDPARATGVLAKKVGGSGGEFGTDHGLSAAEYAKFYRGHLWVQRGSATGQAAEEPGRTEWGDAIHGAAGCVQGLAASLHRAGGYLRRQPHRQPPVRRNRRSDWNVC